MTQRDHLSDEAIGEFLGAHPGWASESNALSKTFAFDSYAAGIAFVVKIGFAAEVRDHHPDLTVGYRRVKVAWSTHDAGGVTVLDAEMAERSDALAR